MDFLKLFLRAVALLPSLIQGAEALLGSKSGVEKKDAVLKIVAAAINVADSIEEKQIADGDAFSAGLSTVIDGVVACLNASIWHKA